MKLRELKKMGLVMRKGISDPVSLALIALLSTLITSYFEYKNHNAIAKAIYIDDNITIKKRYPKIILTDDISYNK